METIKKNDLLVYITVDDLQHEAQERIGRSLSDDEIQIAKDGLESGISTGIGIIYNTIFTEMI